MDVAIIPVRVRSLRGAYNHYRFIRRDYSRKIGKRRRDTFAVSDGGVIYVFSGDKVFILDAAGQIYT